MEVVLTIVGIIAGISLYDYFTSKNWQQVTSETRNEMVFANRNHEYGAYALRRSYNTIMLWVMLGVAGTIGVSYGAYMIVKNLPEEVVEVPKIDMTNMAIPAPPEEELPPPPKEELPPPQERTIAFPPPVIVDIEVEEEVVLQEEMEDVKAATETNKTETENWSTETGPEEKKVEVIEKKEEAILEFIEEDAEFPGGAAAMQQWISKHVQYPQVSMEQGEQGKVYVSFVVEPDGTITGVQVERGVSDDLDREAKRLVRSMPRWKPGKNNGKTVRARCRLPINFTLG